MEDGSKKEIRGNPKEWEEAYQKARKLRDVIWAEIEKKYGVRNVFEKWGVIIRHWKKPILGDFDGETVTKEELKKYYEKKDLIENLAVFHAAISSSTESKLNPQTDLPGDDSLLKFLEGVLEQLKSGNPPAYLDLDEE